MAVSMSKLKTHLNPVAATGLKGWPLGVPKGGRRVSRGGHPQCECVCFCKLFPRHGLRWCQGRSSCLLGPWQQSLPVASIRSSWATDAAAKPLLPGAPAPSTPSKRSRIAAPFALGWRRGNPSSMFAVGCLCWMFLDDRAFGEAIQGCSRRKDLVLPGI